MGLKTSEYVTLGHPDKVADAISDAVLDLVISKDSQGRCACETMVFRDTVIIAGEVSVELDPFEVKSVVKRVLREIGYCDGNVRGFDADSVDIRVQLTKQSSDIADAVVGGVHLGAGDQGMMFGYACTETEGLMPLGVMLARCITIKLSEAYRSGVLPYLRPDGKSQVTIEKYFDDEGYEVLRPATVLVSVMHDEDVERDVLLQGINEHVLQPVFAAFGYEVPDDVIINPSGRFVIGGPAGDCGLTGRKIIVDTYGGYGFHGGGAFSGKDATKVDRSGAYMARYIAKNLVMAGLYDEVHVGLSYGIGMSEPISLEIRGESLFDNQRIVDMVHHCVDMTPEGILERFGLRGGVKFSDYVGGAFGVAGAPWEATDLAEVFREYLGL